MTKLTYTRNEAEHLMQLGAKFERERIIQLIKNIIESHKTIGIEKIPLAVLLANINGADQ